MSMGRLSMVAEAVGGKLYGRDAEFDAVSTDTRSLQPGELFFALRGARQMAERSSPTRPGSARRAPWWKPGRTPPCPRSRLPTRGSRSASSRGAGASVSRFPLIGITGSNGKTTVKEMTAAIMRARFGSGGAIGSDADPILMTWGNLNNEIGLPRTLLYLNAAHKAAVIEMGAARPGDIAYLARIAAPTVAVVTNAARAHLQGFGSVEDVAATKGEIFEALAASGTAVINRDDRFFQSWWDRSAGRRRLTFGLHADADFRASAVTQDDRGRRRRAPIHAALPGRRAAGAPADGGPSQRRQCARRRCGERGRRRHACRRSRDGLAAVRNVAGRLRRIAGPAGHRTLRRHLQRQPGIACARPSRFWRAFPASAGWCSATWPSSAPTVWRCTAKSARPRGWPASTRLFCAGPQSRAAAEAFGVDAEWRESVPELAAALQAALRPGVTVLVKGSRSMGMERVVQALAAEGAVRDEWGH